MSDDSHAEISFGQARAFLAALMLVVPVLGLAVGLGLRTRSRTDWLTLASAWSLALTISVPSLYAALAYTLGRRRAWLAWCFPLVVRPALAAVGLLLALQGAVLVGAAGVISEALDLGGLMVVPILVGLGFVGTAWLVLLEALASVRVPPLVLTGLVIDQQLPTLRSRVEALALKLKAQPPQRIIVGLEARAFVTAMPINLRGQGLLPAAETLYLPTCALWLLSDAEQEGLIGHELAHFRGADLRFTERFLPSLQSLENAGQNVAPDDGRVGVFNTYTRLARFPALWLVQGMALILVSAVNRIRRGRELEADQLATEVCRKTDFALGLMKLTMLTFWWKPFRTVYIQRAAAGRALRNLGEGYVWTVKNSLLKVESAKLQAALLHSQLAHPIDTHPPLLERFRLLGVEPGAIFNEAKAHIDRATSAPADIVALEEALSAIEIEWVRVPGTPVTVMDLPPAERLASAATPASPANGRNEN